MQKLVITGGVALEGEIKASGAKNAALPLLACALLTDEPMTFVNVPDLADVHTMLKLLEELGCKVTQEGHKVTIGASHITSTEAPYDLVKTMRASILVLGPLTRTLRKGQSVASRRLLDRCPPSGPAHQGPQSARGRHFY